MLGRQFDDVLFRLDIATKDLTLAIETAAANGVDVPASTAALGVYREALAAGLGEQAFHATLLALEERAGRTLPPLTRRPT